MTIKAYSLADLITTIYVMKLYKNYIKPTSNYLTHYKGKIMNDKEILFWTHGEYISVKQQLPWKPYICWLKKMHNLKTENYVLFCRQTEDLSLGDSLSDGSDGLLQRDKGGAKIYEFLKNKSKNKKFR